MTYILVEGKEDVHFIICLLELLNKKSDSYKIEWNGSHGIAKAKLLHLEEYYKKYDNILIIDDADSSLENRQKEITNKLEPKELSDKAKIFLFPDNKSTGELEDLLNKCIPENKKFITECFNSFQECLSNSNKTEEFTNIPAIKGQVYTYVDVQLDKDERENRNNPSSCNCKDKKTCNCRNQYCFHKKEIWDFSHTNSAIKPLLDFLDKNVR